MPRKVISEERKLHKMIATRGWEYRMQGESHPLVKAFQDFDADAIALGYDSASHLWGQVSTEKYRQARDLATPVDEGVTKSPADKLSSKKQYKALVTGKGTFVPDDALVANFLRCTPSRISHIRSELGSEGYSFKKITNGFLVSPPLEVKATEPTPVSTHVVNRQLPLSVPAVVPAMPVATAFDEKAANELIVRYLLRIVELLEQHSIAHSTEVALLTKLVEIFA